MSNENWNGRETLSLAVYVETVEGILGAMTTFTYAGDWTPFVSKMTHVTWATSTSFVVGRTSTSDPTDLTIKLGSNYADLGDLAELNPETYNSGSTTSTIYYHPPSDLSAGFLNLTLSSQDAQTNGKKGTGFARMFPARRPVDYAYDYTYTYNFDASLSGVPFSVCLLPVIASVSPAVGSLAGGTLVTIRGFGFTFESDQVTVYAGGQLCPVVSSDLNVITCRTSSSPPFRVDELLNGDNFIANSTRDYGSSGVWVKLWSCVYCSSIGNDHKTSLTFPWRSGLSLSLWYSFGSNWPQQAGTSTVVFTADIHTILTVPYSGYYSFYLNVDDSAQLYGSIMTDGVPAGEILLASSYYQPPDEFFAYTSQISRPMHLLRGQRYRLRIRAVSRYSGALISVLLGVQPVLAFAHGDVLSPLFCDCFVFFCFCVPSPCLL